MDFILIIISSVLVVETLVLGKSIYKYAEDKDYFFSKIFKRKKMRIDKNDIDIPISVFHNSTNNAADIINSDSFKMTNYLNMINNNSENKKIYYFYSYEDDVFNKNENINYINDKKCIVLNEGENVFGKKELADIDIDDPSVSRRHFIANVKNNMVSLTDCNSTNGTFVNHQKIIDRTVLIPEDIVTVGKVTLILGIKDD